MVLAFKPEVDQRANSDDINLPCEERLSDSPFVERVWRSRSDDGGSFISSAQSHWEMVVTKYQDRTTLTVRGPETRATPAFCPPTQSFVAFCLRQARLCRTFP